MNYVSEHFAINTDANAVESIWRPQGRSSDGLVWIGWCGFFVLEFPLWVLPGVFFGSPPQMRDAVHYSQYLASMRVIALTRVLLDIGMYASMMVFFAGLRHLILKTRAEYEWVGTLALVAGAVWWAVSLVDDGLEGGAVLTTPGGGHRDAIPNVV